MNNAEVTDHLISTGFRCWPTKIIFVVESDKYKCVFDLGLGLRAKRTAVLGTSYTPPDPHSMNDVERTQAREAKLFVMDVFMGLDGVAVVQEKGERCIIRDLYYSGKTQYEVACEQLPQFGQVVNAGRYLEVMRAYDFDRGVSDFVYGGAIGP